MKNTASTFYLLSKITFLNYSAVISSYQSSFWKMCDASFLTRFAAAVASLKNPGEVLIVISVAINAASTILLCVFDKFCPTTAAPVQSGRCPSSSAWTTKAPDDLRYLRSAQCSRTRLRIPHPVSP